MIDELSQIHEWDGGGLHATMDPGANIPAQCGLMVSLKGADYSQAFPADKGEQVRPAVPWQDRPVDVGAPSSTPTASPPSTSTPT